MDLVGTQSNPSSLAGVCVCVTGGGGFIGSHLTNALVRLGAQVRVIDDFSNGLHANLDTVRDQISLHQGSILDRPTLDAAIANAEIIFHLAAMGSVPRSIEMPERYAEVNVGGTLAVLEAARRHGARRVIYSASSSAYGNTTLLPKVETMRPDPLSPYAFTKLAGEHLMRAWASCYSIETISLRYFNIFGSRQRHDSAYAAVIPAFAAAIRENRTVSIHGDGTQTRDFTHVNNAVHANLLAATTGRTLRGEVVNIACGTRFSLLYLTEQISRLLGRPARVEFLPPRAGDVKDSEAAISRAREMIGYQVQVPFEHGLRQVVLSVGSESGATIATSSA